MKKTILPLLTTLAVMSDGTLAASRTLTLDVQNMTCPVCPLTIKKAIKDVSGVQQVSVDYASRTVTVEFDDASVTADTLTEATKNAGYPSTVKKHSQ